jgi:hypothetical protein
MEKKHCAFTIENLLREEEQTTRIVLDDADSTMMDCQNSVEDPQDGRHLFA